MDASIFRRRRTELRQKAGGDVLFFPGNPLIPRNYAANVFAFRQNSQLLYLTGISCPGLALVMGPKEGQDLLFGPAEDFDDVVWHGPQPSLKELAASAGIEEVHPMAELGPMLCSHKAEGEKIRFLPPYHERVLTWMSRILGEPAESLRKKSCPALLRAVVEQRLIKGPEEIAEMDQALEISHEMHVTAMKTARPGISEAVVAAAIQEVSLRHDSAQAYQPIVTVRGEVLHNHHYKNVLKDGDLLLNDSGSESQAFYASDITRTFPVNGRFSPKQKAIYEVCLAAQLASIEAVKPGVNYRDVHLIGCQVIVEGLAKLGLMTEAAGKDPAAAVADGAHALFFPHGMGHAIGLDVHDMEDLGDVVGYGEEGKRSSQFGLNFLRFARPLEAGHVVTVEPGIYFIPVLMDRWESEGLHQKWINYAALKDYRGFGGIRIEDDVLCTETGHRVLGPGIPKTVAELEAICQG